jgi:hypothetical protein
MAQERKGTGIDDSKQATIAASDEKPVEEIAARWALDGRRALPLLRASQSQCPHHIPVATHHPYILEEFVSFFSTKNISLCIDLMLH